jgi:hypothetical protein
MAGKSSAEIQQWLAAQVAKATNASTADINVDAGLPEGMQSILAVQLASGLSTFLSKDVTLDDFRNHATIRSLSAYLSGEGA